MDSIIEGFHKYSSISLYLKNSDFASQNRNNINLFIINCTVFSEISVSIVKSPELKFPQEYMRRCIYEPHPSITGLVLLYSCETHSSLSYVAEEAESWGHKRISCPSYMPIPPSLPLPTQQAPPANGSILSSALSLLAVYASVQSCFLESCLAAKMALTSELPRLSFSLFMPLIIVK